LTIRLNFNIFLARQGLQDRQAKVGKVMGKPERSEDAAIYLGIKNEVLSFHFLM